MYRPYTRQDFLDGLPCYISLCREYTLVTATSCTDTRFPFNNAYRVWVTFPSGYMTMRNIEDDGALTNCLFTPVNPV